MSQSIERLERQFHRMAQLDHASTFLNWDQMVMMPNAGMGPRAEALAELASLRHELLIDPAMGDCLATAEQELASGKIDPSKATHVREMKRTWQQAVALPARLVHAKVLAGSRCEHAWRTQKASNDWRGFLANFSEVVALSREEAQCRQAQSPERFSTPYDALLDLHCTGDRQALISAIFAQLKRALPSILASVLEKQAVQSFVDLRGCYALDQQQALNESLIRRLGFDFNAGRLDVSMHPFSTGGRGDQRITTRYRECDFADAMLATAHETGHASYEAGLPAELQSFPIGRARNMCIHESQSLLFEKQIVLSRSFSKALLNVVHEHLPSTQKFSSDDIWRAMTRVKPGYIRVEADEVTYPLHVMLRYDIESALINGDMEADVIPDVWEESMNAYFGLSVDGNHAIGCLQDIHWTDGAFGYFPSYIMGAVNAAQLAAAMRREHGDWQARLSNGDIGFFRQWLAQHVWRHGCEWESQELMTAATGSGSNVEYLLQHLQDRYLHELD